MRYLVPIAITALTRNWPKCRNNHGAMLHSSGKYAEAEPLYRRSIAIEAATPGPGHPQTATAADNQFMQPQTEINLANITRHLRLTSRSSRPCPNS